MVSGRGGRFIAFSLLFLFLTSPLHAAGNKEMVEKEVQELDRLNKRIVEKLPEMPKNGVIDLKARVYEKNGEYEVEILEEKVLPYKKGSLDFETSDTVEKGVGGGDEKASE